jgi:2EXR family
LDTSKHLDLLAILPDHFAQDLPHTSSHIFQLETSASPSYHQLSLVHSTPRFIAKMADWIVSETPCPDYTTGRRCKAFDTIGCPHIHDSYLRKEFFDKRNAEILKKKNENQKRENDKKLAASRANLQERYSKGLTTKDDNTPAATEAKENTSTKNSIPNASVANDAKQLASLTNTSTSVVNANGPDSNKANQLVPQTNSNSKVPIVNKAKQLTSPKISNIAVVNAKIESIIKKADAQVQNATPATFMPNTIPSIINKINNLKVGTITTTKFATVHHLTWATVTYSKPNAQAAARFPKTSSVICKYFAKGCSKGVHCNYSHVLPCVTNPQAPWPNHVEDAFGTHSPQFEICFRFDVPPVRGCPPLGKRRVCPPPKYSWDVYNSAASPEIQLTKPHEIEQQAFIAKYAKTASKGLVLPSCKTQHSKTLSETSAITTSLNSVSSSQNSWDTANTSVCQEPEINRAALWALELQKGKPKPRLLTTQKKAPENAVFHLFQNLPAELRIKVWKFALKDHRQTARIALKRDEYHEGKFYHSRLASMNPSPAILRTNRESRALAALYHYDKCFRTKYAPADTWFNFENDRLFIQTGNASQILKFVLKIVPEERKSVQWLQVPLRDFVHNQDDFTTAIAWFTNLKGLYLMASCDPLDARWAQNPRMARKVEKATEKRWTHSQKLNRPNDKLPLPQVEIEVVSEQDAIAYGVDGIQWGGSVARFNNAEQRAWEARG